MKSFAAVAALVAVASAGYVPSNYTAPPTYETITTSEYTTVCPGPTEIPVGPSSTITVTEATTLTITDCPCTITQPVYTPVPSAPAPSVPAPSVPAGETTPGYTPVVPAPSSAPAPYYPSGNASAPVVPSGTSAPTTVVPSGTPAPSEFPGAAGKTGLSLLAVAGALAAFL